MAKVVKRKVVEKADSQLEIIERGLKTKFVSFLMLILASSIVLWFTSFSDVALIAWVLVAILGGFIILSYNIIVSKIVVLLSVLTMEAVVLYGFSDLITFGSPGNMLLITFIILDTILIYALSKL